MKKQILIFTAVVCGMTCTTTAYAQFKIGGKKINVGKVVQAGTDAAKAITLSDADIAAMSREYMQWMDTHNPLTKPDTEYGKRLEKLTGHIKEVDGLKVNFGVYEVVDVNAFACGDGSVRICAGLMDIMTDDEVMAVVGHEIVTPSVSILAQPSVAVVDEVVDYRDTRDVATEYLNYLYSDEAQEIAAENYFRPTNEKILKKHSDTFDLNINLANISDYGGWDKVQEKHFTDGGIFDQIYER